MGGTCEVVWLNYLIMRLWVIFFYLLFKCVVPQLISFWSPHYAFKFRRHAILCLLMTEEHETQSIQSVAWIKTEQEQESQARSLSRHSLILLMRLEVSIAWIDIIIGWSKNRQDLWARHGIIEVFWQVLGCLENGRVGESLEGIHRWSWAYAVATFKLSSSVLTGRGSQFYPKSYMPRTLWFQQFDLTG